MRRVAGSFLVVVLLLLVPTLAAADLLGLRLPWLPSSEGFSEQPFSCVPTKSVCGPLTFYVGWGWDRKGATLSVDQRRFSGPNPDDLASIVNTYPIRGLWLGVAAQANVTERIGVLADYWAIIPSNQPSNETYTILGPLPGSKIWNVTNTDWWFVDGALSYDTCALGKVLAGFRYDRFATNFKDPGNFVGALGLSSDTGDVTINCYLPFVGLQVDQGVSGQSHLMFRIVGFPWVGGDVKYHDSIGNFTVLSQDRIELAKGANRAYFFEALAEYEQGVFGRGQIGVFAKWNTLHGSAHRIPISDVLDGEVLTGQYRFTFQRQCWTVGGSLTLNF